MTKIAAVFGTRPEAIKLAPVIKQLEADDRFDSVTVSTGQHREMLDQVISTFGLTIDHDLDVMRPNQTLASLSSRLIENVDAFIKSVEPDFVLVQGDTTTVLMTSLACFYRSIPTGHVEAGLRTGNIKSPFPEEANRVLTTPISTLHFSPTTNGRDHLIKEGVNESSIFVTGNTVIDALQMEVANQEKAEVQKEINIHFGDVLPEDWRRVPFVLITGHRRENFGRGLESICEAIGSLAKRFPSHRFIYPVHLNPSVQEPVRRLLAGYENIFPIPPQPYRHFVALMKACLLVLTDSGGVQEEAPSLGKPVLVMRDSTERPEGVNSGAALLVGTESESIVSGVVKLLNDLDSYDKDVKAKNPYGDGTAAKKIVEAIGNYF